MHNRTEDIGYKQNIYKNYFKIWYRRRFTSDVP